ncbi:MAG: nucleoside recognition protein [candidate division Zixibacteria bacterium]|nr:nucleoside recognition protein [candidate division Zixibacteria bacterium]
MNGAVNSLPTWAVLAKGAKKGLHTFWILMRVMIPIYTIVALLGHTPILPAIARFFQPAMGLWHLPGDAALAMVIGHVVNLYAALAVIAAGHWNPTAVTVAGLILGVSHSHLMEAAIFRQMRAPALVLVALRLVLGWTLGWLVGLMLT